MIYLLEDDDSIRKLVLYGLDSQGFQAKGFALPSEFWRAMDAEMPELVLLDIMLPEADRAYPRGPAPGRARTGERRFFARPALCLPGPPRGQGRRQGCDADEQGI